MFHIPEESVEIYKHIYLKDEYRIASVASEIDVFIDLGANIGCASKKAIDCGIKKIIAVECGPIVFETLEKNMEEHRKDHEIVLLNSFATGKNFPFNSNINNRNKEMQLIDDIIEEHSDKRIFLKIDIEGGEYFVLRSMNDNGQINIPKYIRGEFHSFNFDNEEHDISMKIEKNEDVFEFFSSLDREFSFPEYEKKFDYVLGSFMDLGIKE